MCPSVCEGAGEIDLRSEWCNPGMNEVNRVCLVGVNTLTHNHSTGQTPFGVVCLAYANTLFSIIPKMC